MTLFPYTTLFRSSNDDFKLLRFLYFISNAYTWTFLKVSYLFSMRSSSQKMMKNEYIKQLIKLLIKCSFFLKFLIWAKLGCDVFTKRVWWAHFQKYIESASNDEFKPFKSMYFMSDTCTCKILKVLNSFATTTYKITYKRFISLTAETFKILHVHGLLMK